MPLNFTSDLAAYFQSNPPASSQAITSGLQPLVTGTPPALSPMQATPAKVGLGVSVFNPPPIISFTSNFASIITPAPVPGLNPGPPLGMVDYMNNTYVNGFTRKYSSGNASDIIDGGTTFDTMKLYNNSNSIKKPLYNTKSRYSKDVSYYGKEGWTSDDFSKITDLYKTYAADLPYTKFGNKAPLVTRGIQIKPYKPQRYEGWTRFEVMKEDLGRVLNANLPQNSPKFLINRGILKAFSLMSHFRQSRYYPINLLSGIAGIANPVNPIDTLAQASYNHGGNIRRLGSKLFRTVNFHSLKMKYGFDSNGDFSAFFPTLLDPTQGISSNYDDLIPLIFEHVTLGQSSIASKRVNSAYSKVQFRGAITTINHSISPQWSSKRYFGRPDEVHQYGGVGQTFSFTFHVYANSRNEMKAMYTKMQALKNHTNPIWDKTQSNMSAPITKLTLGDYLFEQPGIIQSLNLTPRTDIPWEIGYKKEGLYSEILGVIKKSQIRHFLPEQPSLGPRDRILPRAFDISLTYKVIEKQIPGVEKDDVWGIDEDWKDGRYHDWPSEIG